MATRDEYVQNIKDTALSLGTRLVIASLAANPSSAWLVTTPIVSTIVNWVVSSVLKKAIKETEFGAFFLFIDFRVNQQGRDFYEAAIANAQARASGSVEEKQKAEQALLNAFNSLVRLSS